MHEEEAKNYAKEIGAIFRLTSALTSLGIEELFKSIGCKILDPNFKDDENQGKDGAKTKGVKLDSQKAQDKTKNKRICC